MAGLLVETKLYVPQPRSAVVLRPRLIERLGRGASGRLTLVSAPAGFGKTTLLAEWLARGAAAGRRAAWVSFDESDRAPATFWTYVLTSWQHAVPGLGATALALLESSPASVDAVLALVLNDLRTLPHELDLVLDDYHLVDTPEVQPGMAYLLEHLPPQAHLVISTRADPALPLARLRARGELVELRAADLRFTPAEVAAYLNDLVGLGLGPADLAVLGERTEGWAAALQLAGLSMRGRDDLSGFVAGFAGDDRYVVDYLVDEVLGRQPEDVRDFLVETSVLRRLTGGLCDAVTGRPGGRARLESLERSNLFVVPLDDRRRWYRYHHLFADVLRFRLLADRPERVALLHRRASGWFEDQGEPVEAVEHALAAGDVGRAADLMERAIPALQRTRQEAVIRGWLDAVPADVVRDRPVLAIGFVGSLMSSGEFEGVEARLDDLERWLALPREPAGSGAPSAGGGVVDEAGLAQLPGAVELYRTGLALVGGDVPGVFRHARLAIERAAEADHVTRAGASALTGLALWSDGDLEAAHEAYSACVDGLLRAGHLSDVLGCSITLADIRLTQGRLGDAVATYERALALTPAAGPPLRGTPDMLVGLAGVASERGEPDAAREHLRRAEALGEHLGLPQNPYRRRVAMAAVQEAEGDLEGALALLDEAARVYVGDYSPDVRPVAASRARVLVALGRLDEALAWAQEHGLSAGDELSYRREFEHVTLAGVLLARSRAEGPARPDRELVELLDRLGAATAAGGRTGSLVEVLVLQALSAQARGGAAAAAAALSRAVGLAAPDGMVRVFTREGPPLRALLVDVARRAGTATYARRLLERWPVSPGRQPLPVGQNVERLAEPLSAREQQVLRLLASDLDGPGIARELTVSLNTVRTHTKNIYAKLGVSSRRAAVRRGTELDLLVRTADR